MCGGLVRTPLPPWGCAPLVPGTASLIRAQRLMLTAGFSPGLPRRLAETTVVYPADVVLFEGILVFYSQEIRDMFHLRLFVDTDSDVRLSRRGKVDVGPSAPGQPGPRHPRICRPLLSPVTAVLRDVQRGRDLEQILTQYTTFVKPAFEEFCLPVPPSACPGTSFPPLSEGPLVPVL